MKRLHMLVALFGLSFAITASAGTPVGAMTMDKGTMVAQPVAKITTTRAAISNPKISCGNPSSSNFLADIKNTGAASSSFASTLVLTKAGECTKMEMNKNPDGSPCTASGNNFCLGHCASYGPDSDSTFTHAAMPIAGGATAQLAIQIPNKMWKKGELRVLEQGMMMQVTKALAPPVVPNTSCIF